MLSSFGLRMVTVAVVGAAGLFWPSLLAAETDATAPRVVKIPQLINAIKQHKGKIVVVDFWADT